MGAASNAAEGLGVAFGLVAAFSKTTLRPSILSSGLLYSSPKNAKMSCSSVNVCSTFEPVPFIVIPCSFIEYPRLSARFRITTLNPLLPVKYNTAKGYSAGGVNKKSTRR